MRRGALVFNGKLACVRESIRVAVLDLPDMFSLLTLIMLLTLISRSLRFKLMLDRELSLLLNVLLSLPCCPRPD